MKTIILHIGYPKTGTSSLQWFLNAHRENLLEQGVCYPITGQVADYAHHKLAFSLAENAYETWEEPQRAQLFQDLAAEIDACGANTIVLSSELFVMKLDRIRESPEFKEILNRGSVRVICFLRKQATFMESLYRQFIWDAAVRFADGPEAFLKIYPFAGDYHAFLTPWADFVGKQHITTVVYEQAQNAEGCIKRFCSLIGVDPDRLPGADFEVRRNVTVTANVVTEMMRVVNGCSHLSKQQLLELSARAREFAETISHVPLPTDLFGADLVARIESMFLESNRKLAEDFVHQPLDGCWFREQLEAISANA